MKNSKTLFVSQAALIAALYVVLTLLANALGLANYAIQLTGAILWDIIFGSLATLLGAVGTYLLRRCKWLAPLPPIVANTLIVPMVLYFAYHIPGSIPYFMLTVGLGEILSCGVLGILLLLLLQKYKKYIFPAASAKE